jgi:hypothetical protein
MVQHRALRLLIALCGGLASTNAIAAPLLATWDVSYSDVRRTFPLGHASSIQGARVLDLDDVAYDGVRWSNVHISFDRLGRLQSVQLRTAATPKAALTATLHNADSPLWQVVGQPPVRLWEADSDDQVEICGDDSDVTLSINRPTDLGPATTTVAQTASANQSYGVPA